jgi:ubiquinone/menaquinone biosynthesis C-methylase UbiE
MSTLTHRAVRAAYLGQQASLQLGCGLLQRAVRRLVLGVRPSFSSGEARSLFRRYTELLARDLANVQAGLYPRELLFQIPLRRYARRLPALAAELPRVVRRRQAAHYQDLPPSVDVRAYPPYYRRTFHWQSDGYLSVRSARLYDVGVEFLFGGTADVMRRQALPPLCRFAAASGGANLRVLDVACGTGRTLDQLRRALPDAALTGLDLSSFYLQEARSVLGPDVDLVEGNAEHTDFAEAEFDAVVSVYLFHELPRNARRRVFAEMHRVLRPGGRLVILDSVQASDAPDLAYFLDRFNAEMHEPFYRDYLGDDLATAIAEAGFEVDGPGDPAYLTKVVTATKPVS